MSGTNVWHGIGHCGRDPELSYTQSGTARCTYSIAINDKRKDADGEWKEHTEWVNIVMWGKLAEIGGEYLKKGSQVYVEGPMRSRQYKDRDGADKWITEIVAREMQMLGGRDEERAPNRTKSASSASGKANVSQPKPEPDDDDLLPF